MSTPDPKTPEPSSAKKRRPRRAVRRGTEDPEFRESTWAEDEPTGDREWDAEVERLRREKPPHWS